MYISISSGNDDTAKKLGHGSRELMRLDLFDKIVIENKNNPKGWALIGLNHHGETMLELYETYEQAETSYEHLTDNLCKLGQAIRIDPGCEQCIIIGESPMCDIPF